ncbi:MAG: Lrp/AsnC family transcriptional regulator [Chloroflexi bacterium]|nr:Lrp/AsnC family transcriptional regulator [Chloroflexota bacterium]
MYNIDTADQNLLGLLQVEFPLTEEPFAHLGQRLGIGAEEVMQRVQGLKTKGIVRQISPVYDARRLGFHTTLVAMKVSHAQMEKAGSLLQAHPGISHAYERDCDINLWFTLSMPSESKLEAEWQRLGDAISAETAFSLPTLKLFKIGAYFNVGGTVQASKKHYSRGIQPRAALSPTDRVVVNESQQDLPLCPRPFADMADRLSMSERAFLTHIRGLLRRGIMRRYGAAVNHRRAGFKANALTCWNAPKAIVDAAGEKLSSFTEVSHCYERKTNPQWQYNLFTMIHSHSWEVCREIMARASCEIGLTDYIQLFSTREFKKIRVKYLL